MANTKIDLVEGYTIKTVGKQSFAVSIIQIDPVESKAGKSIVLASTRGAKTIVVDGEEVRFNVNVYKLKNQAKAKFFKLVDLLGLKSYMVSGNWCTTYHMKIQFNCILGMYQLSDT